MKDNDKIQCMECGKYFHQITHSHLKKCSGLIIKEYKDKYPDVIMRIIDDEYRKQISKTMIEKEISTGARNGRYIFIPKDFIIDLANKEYTQIKIAQHFNVSTKCIRSKLKEYNLIWKNISTFEYNKGKNNPMYGKHPIPWNKELKSCFSEETIIKKSNSAKRYYENEHEPWNKGKTGVYSEETLIQMRISRIEELENKNGQIFPNYNPDACIFFEKENNKRNLNGLHALNGGEYYIKELGYFVDNFVNELNIIEEYDESHHFYKNGWLKKKDFERMFKIINYLNCSFNRYRENKKTNKKEIYFKYFPGFYKNNIELIPSFIIYNNSEYDGKIYKIKKDVYE